MPTPGSKRGCEKATSTNAGGWTAFARSFRRADQCSTSVAVPVSRSRGYVSECGYAVTGVDSSPAMIAKFRARLPGQQALVSDMRTLSLRQLFHGILAWDSFFHLNHEDQRLMFPIFRAHAAPAAALMFTSGPAHGEAIGRLEGEPLYHASLDAAEYRTLLEAAGFVVVAIIAEDKTCGGRTVWLAQLR